MTDDNTQSAIIAMHRTSRAAADPNKTCICFGIARGGTSAVAGVLQRLGVFMGEDLTNTYEDSQFNGVPLPQMQAAIGPRNAEHRLWGWKNPDAVNHIDRLLPNLRNPHLIIVHRDMVATMAAHIRWHGRTELYAAQEILLKNQRNWNIVERLKLPTALISYEKLILSPEPFVAEMADFLALPRPDPEVLREIAGFLRPGEYK